MAHGKHIKTCTLRNFNKSRYWFVSFVVINWMILHTEVGNKDISLYKEAF